MPQEVNYFDIDHWIVYVFLAGILYVGLRVGRGVKDMNDYAIAGKSYGTTTLVLTFLATGFGGSSTLGTASNIFSDGIIMLIACFGACIAVLFICYYIIPRMVKPGDSISMGDLMGKFYGEDVQIFTGIIGVIYSTGIVAAQALALGFMFEALLGVEKGIGIGIGGTIMVLYSAMGGVRSVTITDAIQFAVLIVIVPLIAGAAINQAGGMAEIFDALPPEKWLIWQHEKFNYYMVLFLLYCIPALNMGPSVVQRMLMARDREQRQRMFLTDLQVAIPFNFMVALVGLSALTLYPALNPKNVFPHMIAQSMPIVLKGLSIAGILAVIMSTADSYLNTGSIMLVHDVLKTLRKRQHLALDELYWVRVVTLLLGFGAMFVAYFSTNIITLIFYTISLYAPLITIPFVAGLIGMKVDTRSFFNAAVAAFVTYVLGKLVLPKAMGDLVVLLSLVVNGVTFFTTHVVQHKGIAWISTATPPPSTHTWIPTWAQVKQHVVTWIPTPSNIYGYTNRQVAQYSTEHMLFGAFCGLNYIIPYFMWDMGNPDHLSTMLVIRMVAGVLCVGLLLRNQWPVRFQRYFPMYWHFTLLYTLPFLTTVMLLLSPASTIWMVNLALSIILLLCLVDWGSFLLLASTGVILGLTFYRTVVGIPTLPTDMAANVVYTGIFATLIGLVFARRKEQHFEAKLRTVRAYVQTMTEGLGDPAMRALTHCIDERVNKFTREHIETADRKAAQEDCLAPALQKNTWHEQADGLLQQLMSNTHEVVEQVHSMKNALAELLRAHVIVPRLQRCSVGQCTLEVLHSYFHNTLPEDFRFDLSEDFQAHLSLRHFKYALFHLLASMYAHTLRKQVDMRLASTGCVHIRLYKKKCQASALEEETPHGPLQHALHNNPQLAVSRLLVEAHCGTLLYTINNVRGDSYTEYVVQLPLASADSPQLDRLFDRPVTG